MEVGTIIALNLKQLRMERDLSMGQLSQLSGVSKAMLSDIEKGSSNPTINTIWKIANGLNVPYTRLMEGIENETTLVQREDAVMQAGDTEHYRVYCYFPSTPTRNFEWFYVELDANSCNTSIGHLKRAQEYIYVIEGVLELETGVNHYRLQSGDGFVFDASIAHTYQNHQNTLLRMMIINYYLGS